MYLFDRLPRTYQRVLELVVDSLERSVTNDNLEHANGDKIAHLNEVFRFGQRRRVLPDVLSAVDLF